MENFKIDLFEKETGELFPSFQKLNQTDCNICYQHFRKNIKVYDLHESVFDNFQSNGSFIEKYNALDDHFSLLELFADLNLRCDVICINWDEFKTIDVFRTIDLYNYFLPSVRNSMFQDFTFTKEKINAFNKLSNSNKYRELLNQNCITFEYNLEEVM